MVTNDVRRAAPCNIMLADDVVVCKFTKLGLKTNFKKCFTVLPGSEEQTKLIKEKELIFKIKITKALIAQ